MSKKFFITGSSLLHDPIVTAWLAQLTTSFGSNPSSAYIAALNTMIAGMRTDGDLLELDRFWIFAQEVQDYSRVSIVNPASTQITEVNTPTWTALQGYTGNGVNKYLNTNFNYSTNAVKTLRDSISHGVYITTNAAEAKVDAGVYTNVGGTRDIIIAGRWSDGRMYGSANNQTGEANGAVADSLGLFSAQRTSSAGGATARKNGVSIATKVEAEGALPNLSDFVLCMNFNSATSYFSSKRVAMRFIGSGAINHTDFYNRFQTFATAIGFNV